MAERYFFFFFFTMERRKIVVIVFTRIVHLYIYLLCIFERLGISDINIR